MMDIRPGVNLFYGGLSRKVIGLCQMDNTIVVLFQNRTWAYYKDVHAAMTAEPSIVVREH